MAVNEFDQKQQGKLSVKVVHHSVLGTCLLAVFLWLVMSSTTLIQTETSNDVVDELLAYRFKAPLCPSTEPLKRTLRALSYAWHTAKCSCYYKLSTSAAVIFTLSAHVEAKTLVPICAPMDVLVSKQGLVSWHIAILR